MIPPKIHVLLVSAQAAPNLLPALDPDLKPESAILLVSAKMKKQGDALGSALSEAGIKIISHTLTNEHDFTQMSDEMLKVAAEHEHGGIALNLTGGTKLMALAAQSVAQAAGWRTFYVDADTDEVIWLGNGSHRQKLGQQLKLRHYLKAYGFNLNNGISRPAREPRHDELLSTLVTQAGSMEKPLGQLNYLAQQAEGKNTLKIRMDEHQRDSRNLEALLRNFREAGVLQVEKDEIIFADEVGRDFTKGGWLETYVYRTVAKLHGELGMRDKAANLVVSDADGVKNELDVAFLSRNRLFVIECKTQRMDKGDLGKANDTLFKLSEVCRRVGGLGTRGMLATYRALGDAEKKLARALNIEVVTGTQLVRLEEALKKWVR